MLIRECLYLSTPQGNSPFRSILLGELERQAEFNFDPHQQLELFDHDRDMREMPQREVAEL